MASINILFGDLLQDDSKAFKSSIIYSFYVSCLWKTAIPVKHSWVYTLWTHGSVMCVIAKALSLTGNAHQGSQKEFNLQSKKFKNWEENMFLFTGAFKIPSEVLKWLFFAIWKIIDLQPWQPWPHTALASIPTIVVHKDFLARYPFQH